MFDNIPQLVTSFIFGVMGCLTYFLLRHIESLKREINRVHLDARTRIEEVSHQHNIIVDKIIAETREASEVSQRIRQDIVEFRMTLSVTDQQTIVQLISDDKGVAGDWLEERGGKRSWADNVIWKEFAE